ncbi:uncharacterized protein LOC124846132 [Vigna umbellata]|uniref:uncharacterized protein LOC124846132 n=1 Tax=Vigna umbellata TaxID=87088 RepID=UPI001F5FD061|nr:uncharacterized protein LOC124846132 [Vigna umbellata]
MQHSDNNMETSKLSNSTQNIRCHHCAGPLSNRMETSLWTVSPLIRDSFSMIGSAVGGTASAFYGFNLGTPCDSFLFSMRRTDRWCYSCCGTTSFLLLSCSILISYRTSAIRE